MNWSFLISFSVGLGVYFIGLFIVSMIKRHRNKKLADDDKKAFEKEDSYEDKK